MNRDEMLMDRIYDEMYARYNEEARVSYETYEELEEAYEHLRCVLRDLAVYLKDNDTQGAYEYLESENLL